MRSDLIITLFDNFEDPSSNLGHEIRLNITFLGFLYENVGEDVYELR
jgi:hypothetical protein